jgi:SAM-dependent methyltransferase
MIDNINQSREAQAGGLRERIALENQWYSSLQDMKAGKRAEPDWSVYASPHYLGDLWGCWTQYSRKYLREMNNPKSMFSHSVLDDFGTVRLLVDVGCGIGYTTAVWKQLFPTARVVGTNLRDTVQWRVCEKMRKAHFFELVEKKADVGGERADVVFASEYFEHFQDPITELREMVKDLRQPRCLLLASSFNTVSIGHFTEYLCDGEFIDQSRISKRFNEELKKLGYARQKTRIFNKKPDYWRCD